MRQEREERRELNLLALGTALMAISALFLFLFVGHAHTPFYSMEPVEERGAVVSRIYKMILLLHSISFFHHVENRPLNLMIAALVFGLYNHLTIVFGLFTLFLAVAFLLFSLNCFSALRKSIERRLTRAQGGVSEKSVGINKIADVFWKDHAHRVTSIFFILGLYAFAISSAVALRLSKSNGFSVDIILATAYFVLFFGAAIGYGIATWRGRQFERQLQQGRFEKAVDMLVQARGDEQSAGGKVALVLLNDLPDTFKKDKRDDIDDVLKALNIDPRKVP